LQGLNWKKLQNFTKSSQKCELKGYGSGDWAFRAEIACLPCDNLFGQVPAFKNSIPNKKKSFENIEIFFIPG